MVEHTVHIYLITSCCSTIVTDMNIFVQQNTPNKLESLVLTFSILTFIWVTALSFLTIY